MHDKKKMILPPIVLAVVCALCCGLLAVANAVTKDKIAAAEEDAILESLSALPGAGTFEEVDLDSIQPAEVDKTTLTAVYVDEHQQAEFLVTADGYNKGGIQVIIGIDADGALTDVSFVNLTETPGLGTKLKTNPELLVSNLIGLTDSDSVNAADNITGATYSSKGLKRAIQCAMDIRSSARFVRRRFYHEQLEGVYQGSDSGKPGFGFLAGYVSDFGSYNRCI